jgi:hypothetical protein
MTTKIFFSIFFLVMILKASFNASANVNTVVSSKVAAVKEMESKASQEAPASAATVPLAPATKPVPQQHPEEKSHAPKTEELPHIHRYHKERVKKIKRHHKKYWFLGMLLVVVCHAIILFMAYLHVVHP